MVKAMDERQFRKLVNSYGCQIQNSNKHIYIETKFGVFVCDGAIRHPEGIVLPWAVSKFLKAAAEMGLTPK
jgi:hypothetical protein